MIATYILQMLITNIPRSKKLYNVSKYVVKYSSKSGKSSKPSSDKKYHLPKRYANSAKKIWIDYIELAQKYKPLNLGQGFADFPPPKHIVQALGDTATNENYMIHQYTRGYGHPRLYRILSKLYSKLLCREVERHTEILVTYGSYEALYCAILGLVEVGDEVILIEPIFECYEKMVRAAGGIPRFLKLKQCPASRNFSTMTTDDFYIDPSELTSLFNAKTKVIISNTPMDPLGKVYSEDDLTLIADLCKQWNVVVISDEDFEWLTYHPKKHIRMATLPEMWERTITVCSGGKSFGVTGWKVGWAIAPNHLLVNLQIVHQNVVYVCPSVIQEAIAIGFEIEVERMDSKECLFTSFPKFLEPKRDLMVDILCEIGMRPIIPDGGYFITADFEPLLKYVDLSKEPSSDKDDQFSKWMIKNVGIQCLPTSVFYSEANKKTSENYVRFCFIKRQKTLQKACKILRDWKKSLEKSRCK